jgi:hypothetical protein
MLSRCLIVAGRQANAMRKDGVERLCFLRVKAASVLLGSIYQVKLIPAHMLPVEGLCACVHTHRA